jgi:molybdopterin-guanine dinucleotide biosynthesis protein A
MSVRLQGLVMAGGFSRRMGRDKALLDYHGPSQVQWTAELLSEVCDRVSISCRSSQDLGEVDGERFARIHDRIDGRGPMEGICAAHRLEPEAAWLAVACDLPRLDVDTLRLLVESRDPGMLATAFRADRDGLPEPLCAIYEPAIVPRMRQRLEEDQRCPRRLLLDASERVRLIDLRHPQALDNINTPEEELRFRRS